MWFYNHHLKSTLKSTLKSQKINHTYIFIHITKSVVLQMVIPITVVMSLGLINLVP